MPARCLTAAVVALIALVACVQASSLPPSTPAGGETGCGPSGASCAGEAEEPISLLQVHRTTVMPLVSRINAAPTAAQRLELLRPLVWVHIPKTGSGVLNTLYNHPGICPLAPQEAKEAVLMINEEEFLNLYPQAVACPGSFNLSYIGLGHLGFGPYFEGNEGHAIAMFRDPEQQAISGYFWQKEIGFATAPTLANATIKEFVMKMQGCQTKMLALDTFPDGPCPCVDFEPPTKEMLGLAKLRLRMGFGFVGLTDDWDLSMCLFHAKFGGECVASEFTNTRPGPSNGSAYDVSVLEGWKDPWDRPVFDLATAIFEEDLERFGVSHASCESWCYSNAMASGAKKKA